MDCLPKVDSDVESIAVYYSIHKGFVCVVKIHSAPSILVFIITFGFHHWEPVIRTVQKKVRFYVRTMMVNRFKGLKTVLT